MPKYEGKLNISLGSYPKWVKSNRRRKKVRREILQRLGVGPGSATERWP